MKYYCDYISLPLAEKLKEKGMLLIPRFNITQTGSFSDDGGIHFYCLPTYAEVFDWLMSEKKLFIVVEPHWDFTTEFITNLFDASVVQQGSIHAPIPTIISTTWQEAADAAIEKALELI